MASKSARTVAEQTTIVAEVESSASAVPNGPLSRVTQYRNLLQQGAAALDSRQVADLANACSSLIEVSNQQLRACSKCISAVGTVLDERAGASARKRARKGSKSDEPHAAKAYGRGRAHIMDVMDMHAPIEQKVAVRVKAGRGDPVNWILGTVSSYNSSKAKYVIDDADTHDGHRQYEVGANSIIPLPTPEESEDEYRKGSAVFALFPDTTTFYAATIVQVPKKRGGRSYLLEFVDDVDDLGVQIQRDVDAEYVIDTPKIR